ncbi:MAG: hypothetical protein LBE18_06630 [Planctomycetaceae bacterium]|nr:hypothetical protein [Planctomycetaceae bacterium]
MKKVIGLFLLLYVSLFLFFQFAVRVESAESATESNLKLDVNTFKIISEYKENVSAVAISPSGRFVVTSSLDRFMILSDIDSGQELWKIQMRGVVSSLAFTPDGKQILVGCRDKNLIIYDAGSGKESSRFTTPTLARPITAIEISPNGKYAAAGLDNGVTIIFEFATKKIHKELIKVHNSQILDIAFSSKNDKILTASQDASVSIWSVNDGKRLYSFKGHRGPVKSVSFDYRNENIISSSTDRSIIVWKSTVNPKQDSKELILHRLVGHTAEVSFACFSPDAKTAYSVSADKTIAQWSLQDGKQIKRVDIGQVINRAVFSPVTAYNVVWASGKRVFSLKADQLKFAYPKYPLPENKNPFPKLPVVSHPILRLDAAVDNAKIDTSSTLSLKSSFRRNKSCFFLDSKYAVSAGADKTGVVWNIVTGRAEYSFSYNSPFTSVAFSPLSSAIAAGTKDGSIVLFHPKDGKLLTAFRGHTAAITDLAFASNGKRLLSAGEDRLFITWNLDKRQSDGVAIGHKGKLTGIVISPDMSKAITVSMDKTIRVWTGSNQSEVWNESQPEDKRLGFVSVVIVSNGEWFAAGCENKTIEIWKTNEKKQIVTLKGLKDIPIALAVSPDGKYLLSGGENGVIIVWNTKTWKAEKTFVQLPELLEKQISDSKKGWVQNLPQVIEYEPIVSISFSNDGKKIISSGGVHTYLWDGIK